jgi:RNA polymerase sigma factor (sigma-70 family)
MQLSFRRPTLRLPLVPSSELLEETLVTVRSLARSVDQLVARSAHGDDSREWLLSLALDRLPERERRVLELRFGLGGEEPKTLEEIGKILKMSRARVRALETQALRRLEAVYGGDTGLVDQELG